MTTNAGQSRSPQSFAPRFAFRVPVALTIAGSDSGGGAGVQADLKTFSSLGVFGTSAITCVTAQNPSGVRGVQAIRPGMVAEQIAAVCEAFPVRAAKTGMLYAAPIIRAAAAAVRRHGPFPLVVDPVMVATSGARLLREDAVAALRRDLIPLATVITPNLPEAEALWGRAIRSREELIEAACDLSARFGVACVIKGGHLECRASSVECRAGDEEGGTRNGEGGRRKASCLVRSAGRGARGSGRQRRVVVDVLAEGGRVRCFEGPRVDARETHGTGCTFSAALTAWLARGEPLGSAVRKAKEFVADALQHALRVGRHRPLGGGWTRATAGSDTPSQNRRRCPSR